MIFVKFNTLRNALKNLKMPIELKNLKTCLIALNFDIVNDGLNHKRIQRFFPEILTTIPKGSFWSGDADSVIEELKLTITPFIESARKIVQSCKIFSSGRNFRTIKFFILFFLFLI